MSCQIHATVVGACSSGDTSDPRLPYAFEKFSDGFKKVGACNASSRTFSGTKSGSHPPPLSTPVFQGGCPSWGAHNPPRREGMFFIYTTHKINKQQETMTLFWGQGDKGVGGWGD
jgi:hypothetical protein